MAQAEHGPLHAMTESTNALTRIGALLLIVAALYFGKRILIPFALAGLLCFLLAPVANRLERWRVPPAASSSLTVLLAVVVLLGVGSVITAESVHLAKSLPQYRQNIERRFQTLQGDKAHLLEKLHGTLGRFTGGAMSAGAPAARSRGGSTTGRASQRASSPTPSQPPPAQGGTPVPVTIQSSATRTAFGLAKDYAVPLLGPIGTGGLVAIFLIFMLYGRDELRDRAIRLMGTNHLGATTLAFAEGGRRVSRYLLMELAINVAYGIPIGLGLWLIGVPGAALWALLTVVLRFIPYIGAWLAAALPVLLALAVFNGWLQPL
ncbi:MAG TPA: AI-2E family transporter, partial [Nevskiaceae bacterium]